jgi:hypothetical protein
MNNKSKLMMLWSFVFLLTISFILSLVTLVNPIQYGNAFVEIISPVKDQQIPIDIPINISGVSKDTKSSDCNVMLVINKEFPYREVTPADYVDGDFSTWSFMLTSNNYTTLNLGENKITSKAECNKSYIDLVRDNNTGKYIKHSSINVTGISN